MRKETNRCQSWRRGTKCDCKNVWLWVRSPLEEIKYLFKFIFPFFRSGVVNELMISATQHPMPSEFNRMWGTECLHTRFPLPNPQFAGHSVKL